MDPTANLREQLGLAELILEDFYDDKETAWFSAVRLAELDVWITKGGGLPGQWKPKE